MYDLGIRICCLTQLYSICYNLRQFGGPNNKDYRIFGSTLGSLILGNYHVGHIWDIRALFEDTWEPQAKNPKHLFGGFPKLGVPFGGPYNKDYSILGSILGYPNFGKLLFGLFVQSGPCRSLFRFSTHFLRGT